MARLFRERNFCRWTGVLDATGAVSGFHIRGRHYAQEPRQSMGSATRITLSYPADLSPWGREIVEAKPFRTYLWKAHDYATVGDCWAEFVGVGCCGSAVNVELQVESVTGGSAITATTEFEFTERAACGVGGWQVQSQIGREDS